MSLLTIALLFPLATVAAGDDANAAALARRAAQRHLEARVVIVNRPADLPDAEVYLLGGGGRDLSALVSALRGTDVAERVRAGRAVLFAVDAGLDAVGREWVDPAGVTHPGLGLLEVVARPGPPTTRTAVTRPNPELGLPAMIGWVSHDVTTVRDPGVPGLAELWLPASDAGPDGAVAGSVIATRLHGPVLALNPELADLVLSRAVGGRVWPALPVPAIERARAARIEEARQAPAGRRRWLLARR